MNNEMIVGISKGLQVSIPADYRRKLKLKKGSFLEMRLEGKRIILEPVVENLQTLFSEAKLHKPKYTMTANEMDEMIEHEIH